MMTAAIYRSGRFKDISEKDFDPYTMRPEPIAVAKKNAPQSWQEMLKTAEEITKRAGGKDIRKKKEKKE